MSTKKDESSLKDQLLALLGVKPEGKKGVPVKAAIPSGVEAKSLVVNLADNAGSFYVEGEVLSEGAPCFLLDAEGKPTAEVVADGVYNIAEGGTVTVAGGKVEKVEMPVDPADEEPKEEEMDAKIEEKVAAQVAKIKEELEASYNGQILALKKEARLGVAPKPAVMAQVKVENTFKSITQIQQEKIKSKTK